MRFYAYDWQNQDCRKKSEAEKIADIRTFINDAVTYNSRNSKMQTHQREMLQEAEEGNVAALANILLHPGGDSEISEQKVINELAAQDIPLFFKDWSHSSPLIPPMYGGDSGKATGNPWECPAKKRAC